MNFGLDQLAAFLQVVESGSVSEAARRLGLAKSVVSKRVADLEAALGVALLTRSTRGIVATDEGLAFHERAKGAMRELDDAADEVASRAGALCGTLRMTAPTTFGARVVGPRLFAFLERNPRLALALDLDDRAVDLVRDGYDLAIRVGPIVDSALVVRTLGVSERVVCASARYAARVGLPASLEELARHPTIGYANVRATQLWRFEPASAGGAPRTLALVSRVVINHGEAMLEAVRAGLGLAVLPRFIVDDALAAGEVVVAGALPRPVADPIVAAYPPSRRRSPKVGAVIDELARALGTADPPNTQNTITRRQPLPTAPHALADEERSRRGLRPSELVTARAPRSR